MNYMKLLGFQIIETATNKHPIGSKGIVFSLGDCLCWLAAHDRNLYTLRPVFEGDIENFSHSENHHWVVAPDPHDLKRYLVTYQSKDSL